MDVCGKEVGRLFLTDGRGWLVGVGVSNKAVVSLLGVPANIVSSPGVGGSATGVMLLINILSELSTVVIVSTESRVGIDG